MILFTKEIEQQLQAQFPMGSNLDQMVVCKIFNPYGSGTWYVMNQDPNDPDYLWGIVDLFEVEMGSFLKSDLEDIRIGKGMIRFERDLYWKPKTAREVWEELHEIHYVK